MGNIGEMSSLSRVGAESFTCVVYGRACLWLGEGTNFWETGSEIGWGT